MAAKLKVYRTPIGFHDAYVAASSQKAALAAWGTKTDLFARGVAELVSDEALTAEPLAHPGEVIRRSRGSVEDQLAALPSDKQQQLGKPPKTVAKKPIARKPSRDALDQAEGALEQAQEQHVAALTAIEERQRALDAERKRLEAAQAAEIERLERTAEAARTDYGDRLAEWRGS